MNCKIYGSWSILHFYAFSVLLHSTFISSCIELKYMYWIKNIWATEMYAKIVQSFKMRKFYVFFSFELSENVQFLCNDLGVITKVLSIWGLKFRNSDLFEFLWIQSEFTAVRWADRLPCRSWSCNGSRQKPPVGIRRADGDWFFPHRISWAHPPPAAGITSEQQALRAEPGWFYQYDSLRQIIQFSCCSGAMTIIKSVTYFFLFFQKLEKIFPTWRTLKDCYCQ